MKIIKSKLSEYANYVERNNNDSYSRAVVDVAEYWADLMEPHIDAGKPISAIAEECFKIADKRAGGITGFMYSAAVWALSTFWVHGEQLRIWHNLKEQIGHEGEKANAEGAVLNTALLNTNVK